MTMTDAEAREADAPDTTTDLERHEPEVSAVDIERVHELAAVVDGIRDVPSADEVRQLAQLAVIATAAGNVPKALRGKPNDAFMVMLEGRALGMAPTTSLRMLHVIDGQVTVPPKVKLALIRQRRLGNVYAHRPPRRLPDGTIEVCPCGDDAGPNDARTATWHAERDGTFSTSTFDQADAARAELTTAKDNWRKYPARMLSWRALGYLLDDVFPDVGTGLYSPDEIGAVTDEDGAPLDVTSWESPEGLARPAAAVAAPPVPMLGDERTVEFWLRARRLHDLAPEQAQSLAGWLREGGHVLQPGRIAERHAQAITARIAHHERAVDATDLERWEADLVALDGPAAGEVIDATATTEPGIPDEPKCPGCTFALGTTDLVENGGRTYHAACEPF